MTRAAIEERIQKLGPWFYEFDLGDYGRTPSELPPEVIGIHQTRLEMVNRVVDAHFGGRLAAIRCLDIGCHEGFYSVAMARKGVQQVVGVDVREASLEKARFVTDVLGLRNATYREGNCERLSPSDPGEFELTLFLGVLYHLENPMLCLRNIGAITRELCVVETQVIGEVEGSTEWGSREWTRAYQGAMALIDESGEFCNQNSETGASPIAMCPSPKALEFMLKQAGFRRVETIVPPPDAYEQHRRGKRVVCAAYK
jgi:ubiquinone/menaquinone biosynthesis C-methylase UbiE